MYDSDRMRGGEAFGHHARQPDYFLDRQAARRNYCSQIASADELHHQKVLSAGCADFVNPDGVRMMKQRGGLNLLEETAALLGRNERPEELDGHDLAGPHILRPVYGSGCATAEQFQDRVVIQ